MPNGRVWLINSSSEESKPVVRQCHQAVRVLLLCPIQPDFGHLFQEPWGRRRAILSVLWHFNPITLQLELELLWSEALQWNWEGTVPLTEGKAQFPYKSLPWLIRQPRILNNVRDIRDLLQQRLIRVCPEINNIVKQMTVGRSMSW